MVNRSFAISPANCLPYPGTSLCLESASVERSCFFDVPTAIQDLKRTIDFEKKSPDRTLRPSLQVRADGPADEIPDLK